MRWAIGIAVGLVALVVIDRAAVWAESRGWLYWRHRAPATTPGGSGILADLIQVFQPAQRHVVEERDRQRLTADQHDAGAPPLGVDLDRGLVRLPCNDASKPPPRV